MDFDYSKLNGKIKEICKTQEEYAKRLGITATSVNNKLNNKSFFSQEEIAKSLEILEINCSDICLYFFTLKV